MFFMIRVSIILFFYKSHNTSYEIFCWLSSNSEYYDHNVDVS